MKQLALNIPPRQFIPHHYELQIHTTSCLACERTHPHSELFLISLCPTNASMIQRSPLRDKPLPYNLPITTTTLPAKSERFCHACAAAAPERWNFSSLPRPASLVAWEETLARKAREALTEGGSPGRPAKKETTLADLNLEGIL